MMSISQWLKALDKPEYVHVLLNHLPVTGMLLGLVVLIVGPIMRNRALTLAGLMIVAVFAASVYPVVYFGEHAYDRVYSMAYSAGQSWLDYHEDLAETWKWLYYATGAVALIAFAMGLWKRKSLWASVPLVIVLTIASLVAGVVISEAGGKVRHSEFRIGQPPSQQNDAAD